MKRMAVREADDRGMTTEMGTMGMAVQKSDAAADGDDDDDDNERWR